MESLDGMQELSPSPSAPCLSSSNSSQPFIYPPVEDEFIPKIKQQFANLGEVEKFYNAYARKAGFSTRANSSRTSKSGEITRKEFVCYKEGWRRPKTNNKASKRRVGITREGCLAKLAVVRKGEGFEVSVFVEGHNHPMTSPSMVHLLPSHRKMTAAQKTLMQELGEANVPPQQMSILELQCSGIETSGFTHQDFYNATRNRMNSVGGHDAEIFLEYLEYEREKDPTFMFTFKTNDEQRLTHCFWADETCREAYKHFGDVVVFDTSYNTNRYSMIMAPIVGVNHHGQTTVFGCALLSNETSDSFEWFLRVWLKAMPAGPPKMIITNQVAMAKVIEQTLPHTTHKFCIWHVMDKLSEKIGEIGWMQHSDEFKKCIWDSETSVEFEARWLDVIQKANLSNNEWLKDMYEIRERWAPVYMKHMFSAYMISRQRVEDQNEFFKRFVSEYNSLLDFVGRFDRALSHIRYNEVELEFKHYKEKPVLKTSWSMEKRLSEVYTRSMFYKFQEQLYQLGAYDVSLMDEDEHCSFWKVKREDNPDSRSRRVSVEKSSNHVTCSCQMFEFDGIPCRHMLAYFIRVGIKKLPEDYILRRWTVLAKVSRGINDLGGARGKQICDYPMILRMRRLFLSFIDLVDVASLTEDGTKIVLEGLESIKVKLALRTAASAEVECSRIEVPIHLESQSSFEEPLPVMTKDGGKQLKGGKEKTMSKGSRKCTFCNKKGQNHDKRNCPLRLSQQDDVMNDDEDVQTVFGSDLGRTCSD